MNAPTTTAPHPPPHLQAEPALIGAALFSPTAIDDATATGLQAGDFYRPAHDVIWTAITHLRRAGEPVDAVTVAARLTATGEIARVGGHAALADFLGWGRTGVAAHYAGIVTDRAHLRRLADAGTRIVQAATPEGGTAIDVAAYAQAEIAAAAAAVGGEQSTASLTADLDQLMDLLEDGGRDVIPTGMPDLDRALSGGLEPGTLTVLAARPGVGKSAVVGQLAIHVARQGHAAGIASLEMRRHDWLVRGTAHLARVDYGRLQKAQLRKGHPDRVTLTEAEWTAIGKARGVLDTIPLAIWDRPRTTVAQVLTNARALRRAHPDRPLLISLDYLQLAQPADTRVNREQQVSQMTRDLKVGAMELDAAFVVLSQLNRAGSARADKRPTLTDLRESGAIEQDADNVLFLHRDDDDKDPTAMAAILAKARRGAQTGWPLEWQGCYQTAAPVSRAWSPTSALDGGRTS